ncbi:MAG: aminoacyl-tRNA hydrolase [Candidatus Omnitrophica bacterium]|nr:aminoacyl-tRNA hydrolase [Candidatus Omnitrophota bacterium]
MKLIVGLGNPSEVYRHSRHNIGFLVIRHLSQVFKAPLKKEKGIPALSAKCKTQGGNLILALPLTFMNLSGEAVRALVEKYKIDLDNLIVVCDDLDLAFGRLKVRAQGSSAGHGGVKSIIDSLGTKEFARLRIGIGRPKANQEAAEFVLRAFTKREKEELKEIIAKAGACCQVWIKEGITKTMNIFNSRSNENE